VERCRPRRSEDLPRHVSTLRTRHCGRTMGDMRQWCTRSTEGPHMASGAPGREGEPVPGEEGPLRRASGTTTRANETHRDQWRWMWTAGAVARSDAGAATAIVAPKDQSIEGGEHGRPHIALHGFEELSATRSCPLPVGPRHRRKPGVRRHAPGVVSEIAGPWAHGGPVRQPHQRVIGISHRGGVDRLVVPVVLLAIRQPPTPIGSVPRARVRPGGPSPERTRARQV